MISVLRWTAGQTEDEPTQRLRRGVGESARILVAGHCILEMMLVRWSCIQGEVTLTSHKARLVGAIRAFIICPLGFPFLTLFKELFKCRPMYPPSAPDALAARYFSSAEPLIDRVRSQAKKLGSLLDSQQWDASLRVDLSVSHNNPCILPFFANTS